MGGETELRIDPAVLERFPACRVGGFLVSGLGAAAASLAADPVPLDAAELEAQGVHQQNLADEPRIRGWRQAMARCGLKPSTYKSSPEQLAGRLLRGKGISTPLPVVTAYCAVSARHLAPMGAYGRSRLPEPSVVLRFPRPEDRFRPLGGRPEDMPLLPEVAVYASGSEVICWAFNHRDSASTCLEEGTDEALFLSEAVEGVQHPALEQALAEMSALLARRGARVGPVRYVDAAAPATKLDVP
jgi:DNA/RNA-binding domain of Phe-tRNA-synthetase-like protein